MPSQADQNPQPNFPQQNDVELAENVEPTHQPVPAAPVPAPVDQPVPVPAPEPEDSEDHA